MRVEDGIANVKATGVKITNINGSANWRRSAGGQDSVSVVLSATGDKGGGVVSLSGYAKNCYSQTDAAAEVRAWRERLPRFNKRTLADLYVSTRDPAHQPNDARDSLRLTGSVQAPVLTGPLNVDRGSIFLADRDIARKQAVEVLDDTLVTTDQSKSKIFSTLMANLQPNVSITLGDVRLRSAEANVKLTGELDLTTSTARSTRTLASTGQLLPQFSLEGALNTAGGTYNLNLGLVQREFR